MIKHNQAKLQLAAAPMPAQRPRHGWSIARVLIATMALLGCAIGWAIYESPSLVPQAVDRARAVFGPQPVALIESWVFQAQDQVRQANYHATGAAPQMQWAAPPSTQPQPRHIPTPAARPAPTSAPAVAPPQAGSTAQETSVTSAADWSPFVYAADGQPLLERAVVAPDPSRPYVQTALVRIDLRATQLHLVAGTQEPISSVRTARPGVIPPADQRAGNLLAAFNGGFKAANGDFGIMANGTTLLPPINGLATLAMYRDGHVQLGVWGDDLSASPNIVAYRQNCPLLLDRGQPTAAAVSDGSALWGKTVHNKVATWRSGLGLSADGHYLIYAASDGLTVPTLAQALAMAGADRAMQLDINSWWARFVTYTPGGGGHLVAQKLITSMVGDTRQFLVPDTRDFFYVTAR